MADDKHNVESAFADFAQQVPAGAALVMWHALQKLGGTLTIKREDMLAFDGVDVGAMVRFATTLDSGDHYEVITITAQPPARNA